jgi:hypothetical protein
MLAVFCLRLALGLTASPILLPAAQVNTRFFRTHFLIVLGLVGLAAVLLAEDAGFWLWLLLGGAAFLALIGALAWLLEGTPGGRGIIPLAVPILTAALLVASLTFRPGQDLAYLAVDDLTSAALLGAATTAMLVGHSYLIAPTMSLTPLLRSVGAVGVAVLCRAGLALAGLWFWKGEASAGEFDTEAVLWLGVRWGVGLLAPSVLAWMAWETTRIRSTQSATGILYVVVIFTYLGELSSQLLFSKTGYIL